MGRTLGGMDACVQTPPPPPAATTRRSRPRKRLSQKSQVQFLQRRVWEMETFLAKSKRCTIASLPWEEVAHAFKDDMLEQVRENRSLKRQLLMQRCLYESLHAWVVSMSPQRQTPSANVETWRHSHLLRGDDESRRMAQAWIVDQAFHNTRRAFQGVRFPVDDASMMMEVHVTLSSIGDSFHVMGMEQFSLRHSLEDVAAAAWVAENSFTAYREALKLPSQTSRARLGQQGIVYDYEAEPNPSNQRIRRNCLHGHFKEADRSTIVCRMLLHDDAYPLQDSTAWTMNIQQWMVLDRVDAEVTRIRTVYCIDHPQTTAGLVPMAEIAAAFGLPCDDHFPSRLRQALVVAQHRQRQLFRALLHSLVTSTT